MIWQFGELGYDFAIDYNGRTGNKPLPWGDPDNLNYHKNENRVKLYKAKAAIIKLVNQYSQVFENGEFSWTPSGQLRKINLSHAEMNVTIVGNFGVAGGSILPGFQHAGTWYDFFSGQAVEVTATANNIILAPGEFHIFVDKPVAFPEPGLITNNNPIVILKPSSLTAQLATSSIKLKWSDNATGEQGYVLERKSEEQPAFAILATLAQNVSEYIDGQVLDGVTYTYRVKAISNLKPNSDWSNTALIDLPLLAPANLTVAATKLRTVALKWEDRSAHETAYVIEKAVQSGKITSAFSTVAELPAGATAYTDTQIRSGIQYYYRIMAKDADETSGYSNQVIIRPANNPSNSLQTQSTQSISIFPNPAADLLTIRTDMPLAGPVRFQIVDMQGTVHKTFELLPSSITAEMQLNTSNWKEGIYAVQISYQETTTRQLLMIKR
jgi:hypothetical protein